MISSMTVPTWGLVCWWDGRGLVLWLFIGPTGVHLLDFFCSGVQFYLLMSPCDCLVSFLCLDLYVLGDGAWVGGLSSGPDSYVSWSASGLGIGLEPWGRFGKCFFCGLFMFFSFLCLLCLCTRLFVCALWSPAGRVVSWLSFVVYNCVFVAFPLVSWVRCGT